MMTSDVKHKKGLLSTIKAHFPKKRKNKYKVGYEDLLTDSCSLPSIAEESQLILDEDSPSPCTSLHCHGYKDLAYNLSEGTDSAYYSSVIGEDGDVQTPTQSTRDIGEGKEGLIQARNVARSSESNNVLDYSEGEVCSTVCSEDGYFCETSEEDDDRADDVELADLTQGKNMSAGPSEEDDNMGIIPITLHDVPLLKGRSSFINSENIENEVDLLNQNHIRDVAEAKKFVSDSLKDLIDEDISLFPGNLFSALSSEMELEPLVYYESIGVKTLPLDRAKSRNIHQEIRKSNSNIFEKARKTSPISIEMDDSEDDFTKSSESLLLVDEIDAYNLNRGMSPSTLVDEEKFIDISVNVFPGDASTDLTYQMFKTNSLFGKNSDIEHQKEVRKENNRFFSSEGKDDDETCTETRCGLLLQDERYADSWSLYTDTSTLRRSRCSDMSSMSSLETLIANKSSRSTSECMNSYYDGSDEDNGSEASERTLNLKQISWLDEEFLELPAAIKSLWNEDTELFNIIKFLSKWGKYNVIVEGTLDIGDFWEDHIYFQSNKVALVGDGRSNTNESSAEHIKRNITESETDEQNQDETLPTADCQIVDRLFTLYQQNKLLQFNALQQKSLYCSPCQNFHIIEII